MVPKAKQMNTKQGHQEATTWTMVCAKDVGDKNCFGRVSYKHLSLYMDADLNLTVSKQKVNSSVVVAPALLLDRREDLFRVKNGSMESGNIT